MAVKDTPFRIGDRDFSSRLIVGTGKYRNNATMVAAIRASGAVMVTVAVRRVDLDRTKEEGILYHLDPDEFLLLPNTAGCYTAEDAIRYARLARAAGFPVAMESRDRFSDWLAEHGRDFWRLRMLGADDEIRTLAHATGMELLDAPVLANGRLELRHYLREQAVTETLHRYGNIVRER